LLLGLASLEEGKKALRRAIAFRSSLASRLSLGL
jgi:hypothetical protein